MSYESDIRKAIKQIAINDDNNKIIPCTVKQLNNDNTIDVSPVNGDADILDVKLSSIESGNIIIKPIIGSVVHVASLDKNNYIVVMYGEVQAIVTQATNGITFNNGELGGLIKINDLVSKINDLENRLNDLAEAHQQHTHNVTAVGSPTGPVIPVWTELPLQNTSVSDIENEDIKHGANI